MVPVTKTLLYLPQLESRDGDCRALNLVSIARRCRVVIGGAICNILKHLAPVILLSSFGGY